MRNIENLLEIQIYKNVENIFFKLQTYKTNKQIIVIFSGESSSMPESLARAQQMTGGTLYFETVDIRNKDEIRNVFKKVKSLQSKM